MITWRMISEIERAFGFRLYKWQRNYLLGNRNTRTRHRRNGNTFAYCVKLLLFDGEPIKSKQDLGRYADEWHGINYRSWFVRYCLDINEILVGAGFKTRIVK